MVKWTSPRVTEPIIAEPGTEYEINSFHYQGFLWIYFSLLKSSRGVVSLFLIPKSLFFFTFLFLYIYIGSLFHSFDGTACCKESLEVK